MSSNPYSNFDIFFFLITTYFYYQYFKPELKYSDTQDKTAYASYLSASNGSINVYLTFLILSQSIINTLYKSNNCGGKASDIFLKITWVTLAYWIFIFGVMIIALIIKPSLKKPFSDVFGYYWVSNSANNLITELLIAQDIEVKMNDPKSPPLSREEKTKMQQTADAIIKICGNSDILINKITPANFDELWELLTPLMKEKYQEGSTDKLSNTTLIEEYKNKLFNLVVSKDTIGEMVWYVYTGLINISFIKLMISSMKCQNTPETMEKNQAAREEAQIKEDEKRQQLENTVYTL